MGVPLGKSTVTGVTSVSFPIILKACQRRGSAGNGYVNGRDFPASRSSEVFGLFELTFLAWSREG